MTNHDFFRSLIKASIQKARETLIFFSKIVKNCHYDEPFISMVTPPIIGTSLARPEQRRRLWDDRQLLLILL